MTDVTISPALSADLPAVAELDRRIFGASCYPAFVLHQARELWAQSLQCGRLPSGALAGYVLALPAADSPSAWIWSLGVDPAARGHGLGTALLTTMLDLLTARGRTRVWLTMHPHNPARTLYLRHGFTVERTEPHYFGANDPRDLMVRRV